ncbi:hypothetical protein [Chamaesiphon sp. VAR_48_metabat_403]
MGSNYRTCLECQTIYSRYGASISGNVGKISRAKPA